MVVTVTYWQSIKTENFLRFRDR